MAGGGEPKERFKTGDDSENEYRCERSLLGRLHDCSVVIRGNCPPERVPVGARAIGAAAAGGGGPCGGVNLGKGR